MSKIVYLYPQSAYKADLRSDTLWGTLCWAIHAVYGRERLEEFIASYQQEKEGIPAKPELILSSAFPFVEEQEGKPICYLPRPVLPPGVKSSSEKKSKSEQINTLRERKKLKKFQLLDEETFKTLLTGSDDKCNGWTLSGFLMEEGGKDQLGALPKSIAYSITHNTIDRLKGGTLERNGQGQLFHVEEKFIQVPKEEDKPSKTGLFFLAKGPFCEGENSQLEAVLRYLSHIGIGGDRSTGKGYLPIRSKRMKNSPKATRKPRPRSICLSTSLRQRRSETTMPMKRNSFATCWKIAKDRPVLATPIGSPNVPLPCSKKAPSFPSFRIDQDLG